MESHILVLDRSVKLSAINPRLFNKGKNVIVSLIFKYRDKEKTSFYPFLWTFTHFLRKDSNSPQ